jgi:hypothetical protein
MRRKRVEVELVRNSQATLRSGIPTGWEAENCLGKTTACFKLGCPFTVEEDVRKDVAWPFESLDAG